MVTAQIVRETTGPEMRRSPQGLAVKDKPGISTRLVQGMISISYVIGVVKGISSPVTLRLVAFSPLLDIRKLHGEAPYGNSLYSLRIRRAMQSGE